MGKPVSDPVFPVFSLTRFFNAGGSRFANPSLTTRIIIGEVVGLVFGLAGFILLPFFYPEAGWLLRWGLLLWYTTVGAIIGVFGVYTRHPILNFPMPWWFRAPILGAWMNFVLTFFAYDTMGEVLVGMFGEPGRNDVAVLVYSGGRHHSGSLSATLPPASVGRARRQ